MKDIRHLPLLDLRTHPLQLLDRGTHLIVEVILVGGLVHLLAGSLVHLLAGSASSLLPGVGFHKLFSQRHSTYLSKHIRRCLSPLSLLANNTCLSSSDTIMDPVSIAGVFLGALPLAIEVLDRYAEAADVVDTP